MGDALGNAIPKTVDYCNVFFLEICISKLHCVVMISLRDILLTGVEPEPHPPSDEELCRRKRLSEQREMLPRPPPPSASPSLAVDKMFASLGTVSFYVSCRAMWTFCLRRLRCLSYMGNHDDHHSTYVKRAFALLWLRWLQYCGFSGFQCQTRRWWLRCVVGGSWTDGKHGAGIRRTSGVGICSVAVRCMRCIACAFGYCSVVR